MVQQLNQFNSGMVAGTAAGAKYNEQIFRMGSRLRALGPIALGAAGAMTLFGSAAGSAGVSAEGITAAEARISDALFRLSAAFKELYGDVLDFSNLDVALDQFLKLNEATDGWAAGIAAAALGLGGLYATSSRFRSFTGVLGRTALAVGSIGGAAITAGTAINTVLAPALAAGIFSNFYEQADDFIKRHGGSGIYDQNPTIIPFLPSQATDFVERQTRRSLDALFGPRSIDPGLGPTSVPQPVSPIGIPSQVTGGGDIYYVTINAGQANAREVAREVRNLGNQGLDTATQLGSRE